MPQDWGGQENQMAIAADVAAAGQAGQAIQGGQQVQAPAGQAGQEPPVPEAWRDEFKKVVAQRDGLKSKLGETEQRLSQYEAEKAAHESEKAARREQDEQKKMAEQGQWQELLAKKDKQHKEEVGRIKEAVTKNVVPLWIRAAASEVPNLTPEARRDLPLLLREYIRVDEFGQAAVVHETGLPALDDNGKPVDPVAFIKSFVGARSYMLLDGMPKAHGGSGAGEPTKAVKDIETMMESKDNEGMAKWQATDPVSFTQALNSYTVSLSRKARGMKSPTAAR
jgi:hypothetical protein